MIQIFYFCLIQCYCLYKMIEGSMIIILFSNCWFEYLPGFFNVVFIDIKYVFKVGWFHNSFQSVILIQILYVAIFCSVGFFIPTAMNVVADVNFGILNTIVTNELHVSSKYVTMFNNINYKWLLYFSMSLNNRKSSLKKCSSWHVPCRPCQLLVSQNWHGIQCTLYHVIWVLPWI